MFYNQRLLNLRLITKSFKDAVLLKDDLAIGLLTVKILVLSKILLKQMI